MNTAVTPAGTRNVAVKPFEVNVNGQAVFVNAKSKTSAINAALESFDITATQLSAQDVLDRGLTSASFVQA